MMMGIGAAGAGRMSASSRSKNLPWKVAGLPVRSWRTMVRHSSIRGPRVAGSTPQTDTSWRSSPPTPTPKMSRPGASRAMSASWRATRTGWRSGSRYTPL